MPPVQIASLEQHLGLLAWLNRQFGYEQNRDLLGGMKDSDEGTAIVTGTPSGIGEVTA